MLEELAEPDTSEPEAVELEETDAVDTVNVEEVEYTVCACELEAVDEDELGETLDVDAVDATLEDAVDVEDGLEVDEKEL